MEPAFTIHSQRKSQAPNRSHERPIHLDITLVASHFTTMAVEGAKHHRPSYRVEPCAIYAAGKNSDSLGLDYCSRNN